MVLPFLKSVAKVLLKAGVNAVTFGVGGDLLDSVWDEWSRSADAEQRRKELETLAQLSQKQAQTQAIAIVAEEAGHAPPEVQQVVTTYLTQLPANIRRSLRRPSDPTGTTVTPDLIPYHALDLRPLLPERLPRFKPGDRPLPGVPWVLLELLGVGGFGEVWKANHPRFPGLQAALKFCLDPAAQERLLHHEAKVVLQVQLQCKHHPGMVELRQAYLETEPPCLEYEYIDGGELTDWFQQQPATPDQSNRILLQLAQTVGFAHRLSPAVVHRDLKPANILVVPGTGEPTLKIADFGIGGLVQNQPEKREFSRPTLVGSAYTQLYASPQQKWGAAPSPRDDVYSLGVIWYQLLIRNLSAELPTGSAWRKRLTEQGIAAPLLDLLEACVEYEPGDRLADAGVLAEQLSALLKPKVASTPPTGLAGQADKTDPILAKASIQGKYLNLLRLIHVPNDVHAFGDYYDFGFFPSTTYGGQEALPPGFWVYLAPNWYIWEKQANPAQAQAQPPVAGQGGNFALASVHGKYTNFRYMLTVVQDRKQYGDFHEYGYTTDKSYAGNDNLPPGWWVWVPPNWFIWEKKVE